MGVRDKEERSSHLEPIRHPQASFFLCDISDVVPKDDLGTMEHPFFSLSTKPDKNILTYMNGDVRVKVKPAHEGRATIYDKDVLIYCMSQLVNGISKGKPPSKSLLINAYDLLVATNRPTGGESYTRLKSAFERLEGTRVETNIRVGGQLIDKGFGMIESWEIIRASENGRMVSVEVKLSDWLYEAALNTSVLTIHRDYFRLRKALDRRIYQIARKHAGRKNSWTIGLAGLHKKSDTKDTLRKLRMKIRKLEEEDYLPDYHVQYDGEKDQVTFVRRESWKDDLIPKKPADTPQINLQPWVFEKARKIVGDGVDIYQIQSEWHGFWVSQGCPNLDNAPGAFLGFCKHKAAQAL